MVKDGRNRLQNSALKCLPMVNSFTMPHKEEELINQTLKQLQQEKEQRHREAVIKELAKSNPPIDNNVIRGYN
jgi:hypothetical protein